MTTLREERYPDAGERKKVCCDALDTVKDVWLAGFVHALGPYGDYEVVEGRWSIWVSANRWGDTPSLVLLHDDDGTEVWSASVGDHVKLLVPPSEVSALDMLAADADALREQQREEIARVADEIQARMAQPDHHDQRVKELEEALGTILSVVCADAGVPTRSMVDAVQGIAHAALPKEAPDDDADG